MSGDPTTVAAKGHDHMLYHDVFGLFRAVAVEANRRRLLQTLLVGAGWLLATAASAGQPEAFWPAVKALSFDSLAVREAQGDKGQYALALQRLIEGDEASEHALRRLCDASDAEVRRESCRVYAGLLAAGIGIMIGDGLIALIAGSGKPNPTCRAK
jgi:hypothetical protein